MQLLMPIGLLLFYRKKIKREFIDPLWWSIKRLFNKLAIRNEVNSKLLKADVENDLLCIICMHRCRNLIFNNCKHFSICNECRQVYEGP
jgi:hypothetical protein